MRRTSATGHVANKFSAGNPGLGVLPTALDPAWLNSVQEEIAGVIEDEDGGDAVLDPDDDGQLLAAIRAIVQRETALNVTQIGEGKEFHVDGAWDPDLYLEPQGQTLNRADYPALWALVSASGNLAADAPDKVTNRTKWGRGDGATTFEMPDYRGVFLRVSGNGWGGTAASAEGVFRASQNKAHTHNIDQGQISGGGSGSITSGDDWTNTAVSTLATSSQGGTEANPDHTAVWYVIRVK